MKFLLEKGADINHDDDDGRTPLMLAAGGKNLENVRLLLDSGADLEKKDKDGKSFQVLLGKYDFENKKRNKTSIWNRVGKTSMCNEKWKFLRLILLVL